MFLLLFAVVTAKVAHCIVDANTFANSFANRDNETSRMLLLFTNGQSIFFFAFFFFACEMRMLKSINKTEIKKN